MVDQVGSIAITVEADVGPLTRGMASADQSLSQTERQVEKLRRSIEKYGQTSTELQKQIDGLVGSQTKLEKSARDSAAAFESFDRARASVDALRASVDPMFAASKRFEAAVVQLDAALEMGAISASQHAAMVDQLGNAYLRVQPRVGALSASMATAGGMSGAFRSQLQGVGYQVQDFAVQVGAGTSATQAFAQQFPQLASAFGPVGVAIGTLAAVGVPLLVAAFGSGSQAAREFESAIDALTAATANYQLQADAIKFGVDAQEVPIVQRLVQLTQERADLERRMAETYGRALIPLQAQLGVLNGQISAQQKLLNEYRASRSELERVQGVAKNAAAAVMAISVAAPKAGWLSGAIADASALAGNLWDAAAAAAAASKSGMGRGQSTGGPALDPYGFRDQLAGQNRPNSGGGGGGSGGGGGGGANPLVAELEALQNSFQSQAELQIEAYASQQETLESALAQRLLTQQEYLALMEQAQTAHADKMAEIDAYRYGDGLQKAGAFFGDMASALQSGNDQMIKISRAFAASEALVNAWRAYSQVLANPDLPWFAKIPKALAVLSAGMGAVNAIKGGSRSAGGSGAASVASAGQQSAPLDVRLALSGPGSEDLGALLQRLSDVASDRGMRLMVAK